MNRKFTILIILILLFIVGGVFWWWQSGKKEGEIPTGLPEGIEYVTPETGVIEGVVKPAPFNPEDVVVDPETGLKIVKDEIVIIFKEGVSEEERNEIIASIDGVVVGYGLSGQEVDVKIKNSPSIEDLKRIVKGLKQNPKVEIADLSPVGTIYPQRIPNLGKDPQWKDSWNEKNPSGKNWGLEAISTPSAWDHNDLIQKVKIGIVDIGFKINHEDLKIPEGISQISYLNLKKLIRDIDEINSREKRKECKLSQEGAINHGTHIAGIVGALSNNEVGITGILWERDLSIYEIDLKQYNLLKGVEWLLNRGVKIINLSFGFNSKCTPEEKIEDGQEYYNVKLKELRKRFPDLLIIQAAGNSDTEATKEILFNPELKKPKYEELEKVVITVGAIENKGRGKYRMANFSNFGNLIDVVAPGVDIYSTLRDESKLQNLLSFNFHWSKLFSNPFGPCFDFFNNAYGCMQGTSMAAPFVTGVAGLVWGATPDLTAEQVKEIIINSADRPITYKDKEYKILNAKTSVELVLSEGRKIAEEGEEKEERREEKPKEEKFLEEIPSFQMPSFKSLNYRDYAIPYPDWPVLKKEIESDITQLLVGVNKGREAMINVHVLSLVGSCTEHLKSLQEELLKKYEAKILNSKIDNNKVIIEAKIKGEKIYIGDIPLPHEIEVYPLENYRLFVYEKCGRAISIGFNGMVLENKWLDYENIVEYMINVIDSLSIPIEEPLSPSSLSDEQRKTDLHNIRNALEFYSAEYGKYPNSLYDLSKHFGGTVPTDPNGSSYGWIDNTSEEQKYCIWTKLETKDVYFIASPYNAEEVIHLPTTLDECCKLSKP